MPKWGDYKIVYGALILNIRHEGHNVGQYQV